MEKKINPNFLFNKYNRKQAEEFLTQEDFKRKTVSFYRYTILKDPQVLRDKLFIQWSKWKVLGRIYLSKEGINAQLNVPEHYWKEFKAYVHSYKEFKNISFKTALEEKAVGSFYKLTVKVREQIVADGLDHGEYDVTNVGNHLTAQQWNEAMNEGAVVVDMRNHYESEIGHFKGAVCPESETFKEELPMVKNLLKGKENEKVLLYCTGGIRCEKTSAYLKHFGFKDVNQLYGGIIDYVHQINENPELENKFIGKNFVFDDRIAERVSEDVISSCHQCGNPCDQHVNCSNVQCNLLFIQCKDCAQKHKGCCSPNCILIFDLPSDKQKELRAGKENKKMFHSHKKVDLKKGFEQ